MLRPLGSNSKSPMTTNGFCWLRCASSCITSSVLASAEAQEENCSLKIGWRRSLVSSTRRPCLEISRQEDIQTMEAVDILWSSAIKDGMNLWLLKEFITTTWSQSLRSWPWFSSQAWTTHKLLQFGVLSIFSEDLCSKLDTKHLDQKEEWPLFQSFWAQLSSCQFSQCIHLHNWLETPRCWKLHQSPLPEIERNLKGC